VVEAPDPTALVDNDTRPVFAVKLDAAHVEIVAYPPALDLEMLAVFSRIVILAFQGAIVILQLYPVETTKLVPLLGDCCRGKNRSYQQGQAAILKLSGPVLAFHGELPFGCPILSIGAAQVLFKLRPERFLNCVAEPKRSCWHYL